MQAQINSRGHGGIATQRPLQQASLCSVYRSPRCCEVTAALDLQHLGACTACMCYELAGYIVSSSGYPWYCCCVWRLLCCERCGSCLPLQHLAAAVAGCVPALMQLCVDFCHWPCEHNQLMMMIRWLLPMGLLADTRTARVACGAACCCASQDAKLCEIPETVERQTLRLETVEPVERGPLGSTASCSRDCTCTAGWGIISPAAVASSLIIRHPGR